MSQNYFYPVTNPPFYGQNLHTQIQPSIYNTGLRHVQFPQTPTFRPRMIHDDVVDKQRLKNTFVCSSRTETSKYHLTPPVSNTLQIINNAQGNDTKDNPENSETNKNAINCKKKMFVFKQAEVITHEEHQESIKNSPAYFLGLYLDMEVINWLISEASKKGKEQKNFIPPTEEEMRCFIAVLYFSGYLDVPRRRMLWERSPDTHCSLISNAMQRDRFESIFTSLQAGDNLKDDVERFNQIKPLIDLLNTKFLRNCPIDDQHSLAEITVSSSIRHHNMKNPGKIVKVWCGCIKTGYCLYFTTTLANNEKCNIPSIGQLIIMHYVQLLHYYNPSPYSLILEKNYCEQHLVDELQKAGIQTIRADREKSRCLLNPVLGGVDRLESNLNLYRTSFKGRKLYSTLLNFCLDLMMNNAWHLYKDNVPDKKPLDLLGFRRNIVIYYLEHYARPTLGHKGGRPLKSKMKVKRYPPSDARFDGIRHYVIPQEKQTRCGRCTAKTTTRCQKCDIGVHVKCFIDFHTRTKDSCL